MMTVINWEQSYKRSHSRCSSFNGRPTIKYTTCDPNLHSGSALEIEYVLSYCTKQGHSFRSTERPCWESLTRDPLADFDAVTPEDAKAFDPNRSLTRNFTYEFF